jgi:hypothetical protein
MGYDRFYGFNGGETNRWYPDLAEDNHYIDDGYEAYREWVLPRMIERGSCPRGPS